MRKTHFWANNLSAIYELTGLPKGKSLQTHYRGGDILYRCKSALEEHLCQKEKDLFSLDDSIILYDLKNTYFEGQCKDNPQAAYGRSKEKRSDCKLATLALVTDGQGFPKYSRFYPGNQVESHTFVEMIKEIKGQRAASEHSCHHHGCGYRDKREHKMAQRALIPL